MSPVVVIARLVSFAFFLNAAFFLWRALRSVWIRRRYCGMTCRGGSERRRCPCAGPWECRVLIGLRK